MRNPVSILVKQEQLTLEGIHQYYVACEKDEWKFDVLVNLYANLDIQQALIYCNTKAMVVELARKLTDADFVVSVIHSDLS